MSKGGWPPDLADPGTRLGQLQRGLGSGARAAIAAGSDAVDDVLHCLAYDPRWDRQIDSRAEYYADLVLAIGVELRELDRLLETHDERTHADDLHRDPITLSVLSALLDRGEIDAATILHAEARRSRYWPTAIDALTYTERDRDLRPDREQYLVGLADALCDQFPTVDELFDALDPLWQTFPPHGREPWRTWAETHPLIAEVRERIAVTHAAAPSRPSFDEWSTERLLAHSDARAASLVARALRGRTDAADTALLRATAIDLEAPMRPAAIRALGERGDLVVLPIVLELSSELPQRLRGAHNRAMRGLPFEATRPIARAWLETSTDPFRARVAAGLYAEHADAEDVDFVRAMLTQALDAGSDAGDYVVSDFAEALGRAPDLGPYPELDRAFHEMPYSYGRTFVARAIAESDPGFARGLARDCLWDSEPVIRELAADCIALDVPDARQRLHELARDPNEPEYVREAAIARLDD